MGVGQPGGPEIAFDLEGRFAGVLCDGGHRQIRRSAIETEVLADEALVGWEGFVSVDAVGAGDLGGEDGNKSQAGAEFHDDVAGLEPLAKDALLGFFVKAIVQGADNLRRESGVDSELDAMVRDDAWAAEIAPAGKKSAAVHGA